MRGYFFFLASCGGRRDWTPSAQDLIRTCFDFLRGPFTGRACASFGLTVHITIAAVRPRAGDGAYAERRDTAVDMVGFARRQFSCALAAQYSSVIVHVFLPFVSAVAEV